MPGARVLASTASASGPVVWIFSSARLRLAETQKYGSHRSSICDVGEEPPHEPAVLAAALEREERDRHVVERIGEPRAGLVHDARRVPAEIPLRADHRAHARAAERIDRDVQLAQRAQHAEMGEPAREAAAEREPDRRSRSGSAPRARRRRPVRAARAGGDRACGRGATAPCASARPRVAVHEDERDARPARAAVLQPFTFDRAGAGFARRIRQDHDAIRLPEAALGPGRRVGSAS